MRSSLTASKTALLVVISSLAFVSSGCQKEYEQDLETIQNQWAGSSSDLMVNHGKVVIKLEPHGSIRAKVFQGQIPVYEFILDREKQQNLLTNTIDNADVYLTGEHRDGLVIDDLQSRTRYVLSFYDVANRLKDIPTSQPKTIFIKGYAMGLAPYTQSVALNSY
ncbi:hypothetical protein ACFSUS_25645 [Spirosoma soli]|uniref:DUF4249 family protein n=1 Tax=Spirosoma soli TaxID=1770529 RepID=A0ABW5MC39_9BACT